MAETVDPKDIYKKQVLEKFEYIQKLSRDYSSDVNTAFFLELDSFLDNFSDMYHLN